MPKIKEKSISDFYKGLDKSDRTCIVHLKDTEPDPEFNPIANNKRTAGMSSEAIKTIKHVMGPIPVMPKSYVLPPVYRTKKGHLRECQ